MPLEARVYCNLAGELRKDEIVAGSQAAGYREQVAGSHRLPATPGTPISRSANAAAFLQMHRPVWIADLQIGIPGRRLALLIDGAEGANKQRHGCGIKIPCRHR